MNNRILKVRVLKIELYDRLIGYLAGYQDGKTIFTFVHDYITQDMAERPTFSLKYYKKTDNDFRYQLKSRIKLPAFFSNLLPEGELREYLVKQLKVDTDAEFEILARLGRDLPGAISAIELSSKEIPPSLPRQD